MAMSTAPRPLSSGFVRAVGAMRSMIIGGRFNREEQAPPRPSKDGVRSPLRRRERQPPTQRDRATRLSLRQPCPNRWRSEEDVGLDRKHQETEEDPNLLDPEQHQRRPDHVEPLHRNE